MTYDDSWDVFDSKHLSKEPWTLEEKKPYVANYPRDPSYCDMRERPGYPDLTHKEAKQLPGKFYTRWRENEKNTPLHLKKINCRQAKVVDHNAFVDAILWLKRSPNGRHIEDRIRKDSRKYLKVIEFTTAHWGWNLNQGNHFLFPITNSKEVIDDWLRGCKYRLEQKHSPGRYLMPIYVEYYELAELVREFGYNIYTDDTTKMLPHKEKWKTNE